MRLTTVQIQLLNEVQNRGGRVRSLRNLTCDLGIGYRWAWACLSRLERAGLVVVERRKGHPLVVTSKPENAQTVQTLQTLHSLREFSR